MEQWRHLFSETVSIGRYRRRTGDESIDCSSERLCRCRKVGFTMDNRNRSRDVSSDDQRRATRTQSSSQKKRQQPSSAFHKTADVDDPPFSRLFLLIPKSMSEDELRDAFQVHGTIQDIHMVRDKRNQESKGESQCSTISPLIRAPCRYCLRQIRKSVCSSSRHGRNGRHSHCSSRSAVESAFLHVFTCQKHVRSLGDHLQFTAGGKRARS